MKNRIIFLFLVAVTLFPAGLVLAENAVLSVVPADGSKTVGEQFNVSINLDGKGNKVCVVKGALAFENLTCKNITVESGLMAQTAPTCASPTFTIGIPSCVTASKNLLSVFVKAEQAGEAKLSLIGVKIIGAGADVAFSPLPATYAVKAVQVQQPAPKPAVETVQQEPAEPEVVAELQPEQQETENVIPGQAGAASLLTVAGEWLSSPIAIILALIIVALLGIWVYNKYYRQKPKQR